MTLRRRAIAAALVVLASLAGSSSVSPTASAQETAPAQKAARKGRVPVSNDILPIKIPKPSEAVLSNGLRLIVVEDHRLPQISFQLVISGAGSYFDPDERSGLAASTAALLREGTTTRSAKQLAQELEIMAAALDVSADRSLEATIAGACLSDQAVKLIDLAADILMHPSFPEDEVRRYKQRARDRLSQQRADPGFLAAERFSRAVYGAHPAGRIAATAAAIESLTRDDLAAFHRTRYVPDHAVLAIAGDVSMFQARLAVEAKLGRWAKGTEPVPAVADPSPIAGAAVYFVDRPASVQANLLVGTQAIERTSPDYDVLAVMNRIVGAVPTGRLFMHLREDKGYTYDARSTLDARQHRGDWAASTTVRTEVAEPALHDLVDEVRQIRDVPVSDQELADAKRSMVASLALSLESPPQLLGLYLTQWRYHLPADYWDRFAERVMTVTKEQIQAAAGRYLAQNRLQVVVVGDASRLLAPLQAAGAVRVYDANGLPIEGGK